MKSLKKIITTIFTVFFCINSVGQIKNSKTEIVKIQGNCNMCKSIIESAGNKKNVVKVNWDKDSKTAILFFNSKITNEDEILKRIALVGYDNEKYLAPNSAFEKLPECCKYERKKTALVKIISKLKVENNGNDTIKKETTNTLSDVYSAYLTLKDALVLSDGVAASKIAIVLFKEIDKVSMEKMNSNHHTVWMKYITKISYDTEHISNITKIENQREYFNSLSKNMFEVMKVIKPSYPIFFNHCPMYKDGKGGDWISKESVIKNPFYGIEMLSCGKTVETIK